MITGYRRRLVNDRTKALLDMIEKLESRVNAYWNFFSVVAIAISGWLITAKATFTIADSVALTMAVIVFFGANFAVIRAATMRLVALDAELNATAATESFATEALRRNLSMPSMPGRLAGSVLLHLAVDVAVLYLIWTKAV
jgi:hypothetical protein